MDQQLISVIVAAYNVEKYLDRCVESIVQQSYPHLEIILIDDGSTDRTGNICDMWSEKDSRVKVLHKKNGGISDVRNTGIRAAQGRWIGFVDGDDYILPTMYEDLYVHRVECGMVVCGYETEKDGKRTPCPAIDAIMTSREAVKLYLNNELQCHYYGSFTYFGSYSCNKLYDRKLFTNVSYPKGKKYEDMYIILDLLYAAEKIRFIPTCEYIYIQNSNSITHEKNIIHESILAREKQKEQLLEYWGISEPQIDKLIACEYFLVLFRFSLLSNDEQKQELKNAAQAWNNLQRLGYSYFPIKMKAKLFLFMYFPRLARILRNIFHRGQ